MLVGTRDNVAKLKKKGKSLEETIVPKPTTAYDEKWAINPQRSSATSIRVPKD